MLRTRALRKIFVTTLTLFILLAVYTIPNTINSNVLKTNLEVEEMTGLYTNSIYLLNRNNYLVKARILLDSRKVEDKVKKIISNLTISKNSSFHNGLKALIPSNVVLKDVFFADRKVTLNFSDKFMNISVDKEKEIISSIVYSIIDLEEVDKVSILVDGQVLDKYPNTKMELPRELDKSIGINKEYDLSSRNNINKVVVYYVMNGYNDNYYVPVTKYVNDSRDKVKIIIEELANGYMSDKNLKSFLNSNISLLDYREEENVMFLNFDSYLYDNKSHVVDEVFNTISYSIFDNYDVNMVMFCVNNKNIKQVSRKDLP